MYVYACPRTLERQGRPEEDRNELTSSCELSDVGAEKGTGSLKDPSFSSPINGKLSIKCSSFPNFFWRSKTERMLVKFIHIVYYLLVYCLWQNIMTKASRWLGIQHNCRQESLQKAGMVAWTTESSHLQEQAWTRKNKQASWVSDLSKSSPGDLLPLAKPNLLNLP